MSSYRLNGLVTLVLVSLVVFEMVTLGESQDVYKYEQKRQSTKRYCGQNLSNTLQLVCRGLYNTMFKKSGQEMEMDDYPFNFEDSYPLRSRASANAMLGRFGARFRRNTRGVHDECCVKQCAMSELLSYCGKPY